jgi:hypothetical protein
MPLVLSGISGRASRSTRVSSNCEKSYRSLVFVGNLRSEILVVQSTQNPHRQRKTDSLDGTRDRRVLVQR